jgi:hypothetical protein
MSVRPQPQAKRGCLMLSARSEMTLTPHAHYTRTRAHAGSFGMPWYTAVTELFNRGSSLVSILTFDQGLLPRWHGDKRVSTVTFHSTGHSTYPTGQVAVSAKPPSGRAYEQHTRKLHPARRIFAPMDHGAQNCDTPTLPE